MKRRRNRHLAFGLDALEVRCLLSGTPAAVWVGQDAHDFAGGTTAMAGNGVQDIHIALSGLPAARTISSVDVSAFGGGEWVVNIGPYNVYNGALVRSAGATSADLYLDPYQPETGRPFYLTLTYDDYTTASLTLNGG